MKAVDMARMCKDIELTIRSRSRFVAEHIEYVKEESSLYVKLNNGYTIRVQVDKKNKEVDLDNLAWYLNNLAEYLDDKVCEEVTYESKNT